MLAAMAAAVSGAMSVAQTSEPRAASLAVRMGMKRSSMAPVKPSVPVTRSPARAQGEDGEQGLVAQSGHGPGEVLP